MRIEFKLLWGMLLGASCVMSYASPTSRKLSSTQIQESIKSMKTEQVVKLAMDGKLGSCVALSNVGNASYVYSLKWGNNESENFGARLISADKRFITNKTLTTPILQQASAAFPQPRSALISAALAGITEDPKAALANKIVQLVSENKCGDIGLSTSQVNFKSLNADNVKFYRDDTQKLICSSEGFENEIRDPATCQMKTVTTFLPDKVCRFLYQVARSKGAVDIGAKKTGLTRRNVMPTVKLEPFTVDIKKLRDIDILFKDKLNLSAIETLQSSRVPPAELYLPTTITDRFKDTSLELNKFETLPLQVKNDLAEFVINYEATKNKPGLPEWSPEYTQIYNNIKPNVELHLQTNPDISMGLYSFPTTDAIVNNINDKIQPFIRAGLPKFTYEACRLPTKFPPIKFNPSILSVQDNQVTSSLLQNLYQAKFDDLKINQLLRVNNLPINAIRSSALLNLQDIPVRSISSNPNVNTTPGPTLNVNPGAPSPGVPQEINLDDFEF